VTATPGRQHRTRPRSRPARSWRTHYVTYEANSESGPRPRSIRRLAWTNNWPCRRGHQQQIIYPAAGLAGQRRNRDRRQSPEPRRALLGQDPSSRPGRDPRLMGDAPAAAAPPAPPLTTPTSLRARRLQHGPKRQTPDLASRAAGTLAALRAGLTSARYRHPGRSGSPLLPPSVDPKPELNGRFLLNR
jgi:hypothetical protein